VQSPHPADGDEEGNLDRRDGDDRARERCEFRYSMSFSPQRSVIDATFVERLRDGANVRRRVASVNLTYVTFARRLISPAT
jgi:hypothetical protein